MKVGKISAIRVKKLFFYANKQIRVFDRDEAIHELNPTTASSITAFGSVIATKSINNNRIEK